MHCSECVANSFSRWIIPFILTVLSIITGDFVIVFLGFCNLFVSPLVSIIFNFIFGSPIVSSPIVLLTFNITAIYYYGIEIMDRIFGLAYYSSLMGILSVYMLLYYYLTDILTVIVSSLLGSLFGILVYGIAVFLSKTIYNNKKLKTFFLFRYLKNPYASE